MSSDVGAFKPVIGVAVTNTPVLALPGQRDRHSLMIQNPPGSGAVLEVNFDDTPFGSGIIIAEGLTWVPDETCPVNEIWLSSDVAVTARVTEAL